MNVLQNIFSYTETIYVSFPPLFSEEGIIFYAVNLLILIMVVRSLKMIVVLIINKRLAIKSVPYSRKGTGEKNILILGDSTAVGTGARKNEDTIAGRLARDFPNSTITNLGVDGSLIKDIKEQIKKVRSNAYDMIIISSGGNDIWSFSNLTKLSLSLREILEAAKEMSGHRVIFLLYNSIDHASIFPRVSVLRLILKYRCEKIQRRIRGVAAAQKVPVIELFTDEEQNPFIKNPQELYARDGIHPSSKGYAAWYNRMWLLMTQSGFFYADEKKAESEPIMWS